MDRKLCKKISHCEVSAAFIRDCYSSKAVNGKEGDGEAVNKKEDKKIRESIPTKKDRSRFPFNMIFKMISF